MSEMLERVARTLCLNDPDKLVYVEDRIVQSWPGPASVRVPLWTLQIPRARTAIEAMRPHPQLSLDMFPNPVPSDFLEFAALLWDRMIDKALES